MVLVGSPARLSAQQRDFAIQNRATHFVHDELERSRVYMYREDALSTMRWLVDGDGNIVESATFRHPPQTQTP